MIRKIIKGILIILMMTIIFLFSSDNGEESSKKSDTFLIKVVEIIHREKISEKEKKELLNNYIFYIRKLAHFTVYFLLGLSVISFLKEYPVKDSRAFVYTIIFVFLYACSDEIHQFFIVDRSSSPMDVLIDTLGGTLATYSFITISKMRRKNHE